MNSVIIIGATSMLGLALLDECIKNKTHVTAVVRENSKKRETLPKSKLITTVECDISRLSELHSQKNKGFDALYHFAWESTNKTERDDIDAQNRNIGYTLDAVRFAHRVGCKRFIGAGSQAEYGRVEGIINPEMKVSPDSAYGVAKYTAGKLSSILSEQMGIDFIWTRIFSTYGVNDMPSTMIMYCIGCLLRGEKPILTKCEQRWDYLNCRDAARAFYLLGKEGKTQNIYHIGNGIARPLSEYVYAIRDAIDPLLPLGIGECDYAPKQVMCLCPDISNLQRDTGFKPLISFSDGINETIEWVRGVNK